MTKPMVSYIMTVDGQMAERKKFYEELTKAGYSPDFFELDNDEAPAFSHYRTPASEGATEQWTGLDEAMERLAALFPLLTISVWENDEEVRVCPRRMNYANGKLVSTLYGTYHDPDDDWKTKLLMSVMGELGKVGDFEGVKVIREKFFAN